jgi:hypothetical protein
MRLNQQIAPDSVKSQLWIPITVGIIVGVIVAVVSGIVGRALQDRHDLAVAIEELGVPILESEGQEQNYFGYRIYVSNNGDFTEENVRVLVFVPMDAVLLKGPVMGSEPHILVLENRVSTPNEVMGRLQYELELERLHPGEWYWMWFIFKGYTALSAVVTSDTDSDEDSLPYLPLRGSPLPSTNSPTRASPVP